MTTLKDDMVSISLRCERKKRSYFSFRQTIIQLDIQIETEYRTTYIICRAGRIKMSLIFANQE